MSSYLRDKQSWKNNTEKLIVVVLFVKKVFAPSHLPSLLLDHFRYPSWEEKDAIPKKGFIFFLKRIWLENGAGRAKLT